MPSTAKPHLTQSDIIVLDNLLLDADTENAHNATNDEQVIESLEDLNNPASKDFFPTVVTGQDTFSEPIQRLVVQPYTVWASRIVRRPTDVVFLTHILLYLSTSVPSALFLYYHFTWIHAIVHWLMQSWYCGSFTLMLHNHIHNNGVLALNYSVFDSIWPYILQPLMGHTWNSYYFHHVKHHHVESNGPGDLSSTIRYQRDDPYHFLCYVVRFIALVWIELPVYFLRKNKRDLAIKTAFFELGTYLMIYIASRYNMRATVFVFILPLIAMRIGMMVGNWGQHALVDEEDPDSDFRSSITLIDEPVSLDFPLLIVLADDHPSPTVIASTTDITRPII